jgi:hypothetical protein
MRWLSTIALLLATTTASAQWSDGVPRDRKGRPWPKHLPYVEGASVPNGYHVVTNQRTGLLIAGSVTFGVFYGLSFMGAINGKSDNSKWLYVPVVGPLAYLANYKDNTYGLATIGLVFDAAAQAAGITMMLLGTTEKTELVRNDIARVRVVPMINGLGFAGEF